MINLNPEVKSEKSVFTKSEKRKNEKTFHSPIAFKSIPLFLGSDLGTRLGPGFSTGLGTRLGPGSRTGLGTLTNQCKDSTNEWNEESQESKSIVFYSRYFIVFRIMRNRILRWNAVH